MTVCYGRVSGRPEHLGLVELADSCTVTVRKELVVFSGGTVNYIAHTATGELWYDEDSQRVAVECDADDGTWIVAKPIISDVAETKIPFARKALKRLRDYAREEYHKLLGTLQDVYGQRVVHAEESDTSALVAKASDVSRAGRNRHADMVVRIERADMVTKTESLEPIPGGPILKVAVPRAWRRHDTYGRRTFIPVEAELIGGRASVGLTVVVIPLSSGGVQVSSVKGIMRFLRQNFDQFKCLNTKTEPVIGADVAYYVAFQYESAGNLFVELSTYAFCGEYECIVSCTAAQSLVAKYEASFRAVHQQLSIES